MAEAKKKVNVSMIVCIVLAVFLLPLFIVNMTLIIKGMTNDEQPPSVFGVMPLAVTSGSMDDGKPDCIKIGDMIFVEEVAIEKLAVGDVVTFNIGKDYITHRIIEIAHEGEEVSYFITQGDANNTTDGRIYPEQIHGRYMGRVAKLGSFILFMQTPWGILLFVALPTLAYAGFELASRFGKKRQSSSMAEKDAEIARLRALVEGQASAPAEEAPAPAPAPVEKTETEGE